MQENIVRGPLQEITNQITKDYKPKQKREFITIQRLFLSCCSGESSQPVTTIPKDQELPIFFQWSSQEQKRPLLSSRKIYKAQLYAETFLSKLGNNEIRPEIEEIIRYLCYCQRKRSKGKKFYEFFCFDPFNLVFEELKAWLEKLSSANLMELSPEILKNRLVFYEKLLDDQSLYKSYSKKNQNLIRKALTNVMPIFKNNLIETTQVALSRISAREYLLNLKKNIRGLVKKYVQFLLYFSTTSEGAR